MTILAFRQRLERLETRSRPDAAPPEPHPLRKLLEVLIAYHLGSPSKTDSLADALARGLGYESSRAFRAGLTAGADTPASIDLNVRWADANRRLLALKDAEPDCDGQVFSDALEGLFLSMPAYFRQHPIFHGFDAATLFRAA